MSRCLVEIAVQIRRDREAETNNGHGLRLPAETPCHTHRMNIAFQQPIFDDFASAVFIAKWRDWLSRFTRRCNDLLVLDQIRPRLTRRGQHALGLQIVPLNNIVGSEGRAHDFDRAFFPRQTHTQERWLSVARAFYANVPLPPVELIKLGDLYFVMDGHHRISVARTHGQKFIDAHVIEIDMPNGTESLKDSMSISKSMLR